MTKLDSDTKGSEGAKDEMAPQPWILSAIFVFFVAINALVRLGVGRSSL